MTGIIVACGAALIGAIVSIVTLLLNRKWQKEDRTADRITELSGKVDNVASELKAHIEANEIEAVQSARVRILRFADECRREEKHSKEFFDSVLDDIDLYEHYCENHPKFKNNKTVASTKIIKDLYKECVLGDKFI
jgi:hypothetical protein